MIHLRNPTNDGRRMVESVDHSRGRHLHLADPNRAEKPLRKLVLRLRLHQKAHIDRHARHVSQGKVKNRARDRRAPDVNVDLQIVRASVVIARQGLSK